MEEPLLACSDLAVGHGGRIAAAGIGFEVRAGDCVCVVGENGAGKTTLLRTVVGLQPPIAGEVHFAADVRPGGVGYLSQQPPVQVDVPASVREVVRSGCRSARGPRTFFRGPGRRAADEALARFGAADLARRPFRELSAGQRQRVLLARALCAGRRLLVLDEPATGLDPEAAAGLYRALSELRRAGIGILAATHDLPAGLADATHVLEVGPRSSFLSKAGWDARKGGAS